MDLLWAPPYVGEVLEKCKGNMSVSWSCWCQKAYPRQRCNYLACLRTFKSCLELFFQLDQVVFSNIFCYIFLSRDISARKEKKLFIRLRSPDYTSR